METEPTTCEFSVSSQQLDQDGDLSGRRFQGPAEHSGRQQENGLQLLAYAGLRRRSGRTAQHASRLRHAGSIWQLLWAAVLFVGLLPAITAAQGASKTKEQAEQLKACVNEDYKFRKTTWNESIVDDHLPNIWVERVWWSSRPRRFDFTVLTQLSFDRMPALFNQCTTYTGPMSAAVYLPLVQTEKEGSDQLSKANRAKIDQEAERISHIYEMIEKSDRCQLDLMLICEVFDAPETTMLYPVNTLRNFARMQVRTKLMSAIDVDMMISSSLSTELSDPQRIKHYEKLALQKVATVLPAFEPHRQGPAGRSIADHVAATSKEALSKMFRSKEVLQFKLKVFPRGHTPTNYQHWFSTSTPYDVDYQRMYEPWFITHWDVMPWFDVNFKGYGLNKIVHVASLNYYGFTFQVHPGAWLVHRPHEDTKVRKVVAREASNVNKLGIKLPKNALYYKVTILFGQAKRAMIRGTFQPRLDDRMVKCFQKLPWLQPLKELEGKPVDPQIFI